MTKMTLTKAKSVLRAWDMNSPSTAEAFKVIAADYTRQATKTPATAIAALHRAGIVTKTGRLSRHYTPKKSVLRLSTSFILGYHGCDHRIAERLLKGEAFASSQNEYDWLGSGVYFWEANPQRGLDFARVSTLRSGSTVRNPAVVGAVIDLGLCLDLMTMAGIAMLREAHAAMVEAAAKTGQRLPENQGRLRRQLDCAVIEHFHAITGAAIGGIDTVRGVFTEGDPIYPGAAFHTKTHIQIAVPNLACIKGVFRVPSHHLPA